MICLYKMEYSSVYRWDYLLKEDHDERRERFLKEADERDKRIKWNTFWKEASKKTYRRKSA